MENPPMEAQPVKRCDHICLKDDNHLERMEPHFYGYENPSPRQPSITGVWIVYGWDTMPYPIFMSNNELQARTFGGNLGHYAWVKFWEFGTEWSNH
jgi:hypothetical protein